MTLANLGVGSCGGDSIEFSSIASPPPLHRAVREAKFCETCGRMFFRPAPIFGTRGEVDCPQCAPGQASHAEDRKKLQENDARRRAELSARMTAWTAANKALTLGGTL